MGSKFLGISRQFIHFIELLVPAHEVQADLHGFPLIITLDANDARVEPAARLAAARVDLGAGDELGVLFEFGLCPVPLFDPSAVYMVELYNMVGGFDRITIPDVHNLSRLILSYFQIIRHQFNKAASRWEKRGGN